MPVRHHVAAIVFFWLATMSWAFYHDIWPWLQPGETPSFTIDLADEAHTHVAPIRWSVFHNGKEKGYALTSILYNRVEDNYELNCVFKLWLMEISRGSPDWVLDSTYRVTREGELREIKAKGLVNIQEVPVVTASIEGKVKGGRLQAKGSVHSAVVNMERELPPLEISARGSVLNPLQPVNRLRNLRPGQTWRMPLLDPLADAVRAFAQAGGFKVPDKEIRWLEARVLPETQMLTWGEGKIKPQVPCRVIEYRGDDIEAKTWVRLSDGLVLRQEVMQHGDRLTLERWTPEK